MNHWGDVMPRHSGSDVSVDKIWKSNALPRTHTITSTSFLTIYTESEFWVNKIKRWFTIKRFVQLDPVLVHEVTVIFAVPEPRVPHQTDNISLLVLSWFCVWSEREKKQTQTEWTSNREGKDKLSRKFHSAQNRVEHHHAVLTHCLCARTLQIDLEQWTPQLRILWFNWSTQTYPGSWDSQVQRF